MLISSAADQMIRISEGKSPYLHQVSTVNVETPRVAIASEIGVGQGPTSSLQLLQSHIALLWYRAIFWQTTSGFIEYHL